MESVELTRRRNPRIESLHIKHILANASSNKKLLQQQRTKRKVPMAANKAIPNVYHPAIL